MSLFFFQGSGAHRDLHSFPTRLSSDLTPVCEDLPDRRAVRDRGEVGRQVLGDRRVEVDRGVLREPQDHRGRRSEEHTSELQSRHYLVCRLLLEKKKKYITTGQSARDLT